MKEEREKYWFCLHLVIILGFILRIWNIDWGLPNIIHRWSYHPDESLALLALRSIDLAKGYICPHFIWGSFFVYLLGAIFKIASLLGAFALSPSFGFYRENILDLRKIYLVGRFVTAFWGCLAIYLTYFLGKIISNQKTGLLSALLVAILPFSVLRSHFMTPHVQFAALVLLALIFGLKALESDKLRWYILLGISTGLAIGTYWFVGATPLVFLIPSPKKGIRSVEEAMSFLRKRVIPALLTVLLTLFIVAPGLFFCFRKFWDTLKGQTHFPITAFSALFNPLLHVFAYGVGKGLLFVCIAGIIREIYRKGRKEILLLAWMGIFYLIVALSSNIHWIRRFDPLLYVMVIFGAKLLVELWDTCKGKILARAGIVLAGLYVFLFGLLLSCALVQLMSLDTRDLAYDWVNFNIPAKKSIAIKNWFHICHLDIQKYNITELGHISRLKSAAFDYYIVSDLDWDIKKVEEELKGYTLIKTFSNSPFFLGLQFDYRLAPEDMRYANSGIYIFARKH